MRIAYFDGASGASGDMILGAILDAGLKLETLRAELRRLPLDGYELDAERVWRAGIAATKATVRAPALDTERRLADIRAIVAAADLPEPDRHLIDAIFTRLAEAEAAVHGVGPNDVRFHEVGATDAIVDVAGAVVGLRLLGAESVFSGPLALGRGVARGEHGQLPVPAPAVLRLIERSGAPIADGRGEPEIEALTPTGAAVLTTLATFTRPAMRLVGAGYGAGGRDLPRHPNVLRLWLGETASDPPSQGPASRLLLFECNIDNMNPELYDWARVQLTAAGALDVWLTPIQMKKNRPGTMLSAIAPPESEAGVANVFLRETTTLGVRVRDVWRHEAERHSFTFVSSMGEVRAKARLLSGGDVSARPEHDDCRAIAEATGMALVDVERRLTAEAQAEAERRFG